MRRINRPIIIYGMLAATTVGCATTRQKPAEEPIITVSIKANEPVKIEEAAERAKQAGRGKPYYDLIPEPIGIASPIGIAPPPIGPSPEPIGLSPEPIGIALEP